MCACVCACVRVRIYNACMIIIILYYNNMRAQCVRFQGDPLTWKSLQGEKVRSVCVRVCTYVHAYVYAGRCAYDTVDIQVSN